MLFDGDRRRRRRGKQLKVLLQAANAQSACAQLRLQILRNGLFFVLGCGNVERFDHDSRRAIWLKRAQHLLPDRSVRLSR